MCGPLYDGGGVYALGPQGSAAHPSTVHGNYIHDQCNLFGCLYHDGGTGFFSSFDNVITRCEKKMWLLVNGNNAPNIPAEPHHFTYQGNINVSHTFVGLPNQVRKRPLPQFLLCKTTICQDRPRTITKEIPKKEGRIPAGG